VPFVRSGHSAVPPARSRRRLILTATELRIRPFGEVVPQLVPDFSPTTAVTIRTVTLNSACRATRLARVTGTGTERPTWQFIEPGRLPEPRATFIIARPAPRGLNYLGIPFGVNGDIQVAGDYDGDRRMDVAVFRPSESNWYIQGSTSGLTVINWGLSTDIPVPGDYDGDGKTDLAVFRPSTATWYILKSSNGQTVSIQWGLATDKLVPADYDGDGKIDLAVYRNGDWWILQSSNNQVVTVQQGTATDTPIEVTH